MATDPPGTPAVLPVTLFTDPRVDKLRPRKMKEDSRSCGACRHVYSLGSSNWESSKTSDILRQTKVAHGQVGAQAQCYQGQQYHCLQNISYEAVREWGRRAWLTPCCQLLSSHLRYHNSPLPLAKTPCGCNTALNTFHTWLNFELYRNPTRSGRLRDRLQRQGSLHLNPVCPA